MTGRIADDDVASADLARFLASKSNDVQMIRIPDRMYLWLVEGSEAGDSSGGDVTFFVATTGSTAIPDPHLAIKELSGGRYELYDITRITQVGSLSLQPIARLHPILDNASYGCHNQTGFSFDEYDLKQIANRIIWESDNKVCD